MRNYKFLITKSFIGMFCVFFINCTRNYSETYTYCYDITPNVSWVTSLNEINLIDNFNNSVDIEGNAIVVNFTTSDTEEDGYVQSTLSYTADDEATTITALGCTAENCYTMTPGTLTDTRIISRSDDEGISYYEVTFTYETTKSEPRRLSIYLYTNNGSISLERNTYTCVYNCTETEPFCIPGSDCRESTTSCDYYTCDNGLSGSNETSDLGEVTPGSDCSVESAVYPDLPDSFTATVP